MELGFIKQSFKFPNALGTNHILLQFREINLKLVKTLNGIQKWLNGNQSLKTKYRLTYVKKGCLKVIYIYVVFLLYKYIPK